MDPDCTHPAWIRVDDDYVGDAESPHLTVAIKPYFECVKCGERHTVEEDDDG